MTYQLYTTVGCNIWMLCLESNWFCNDISRMLQLSQFVRNLCALFEIKLFLLRSKSYVATFLICKEFTCFFMELNWFCYAQSRMLQLSQSERNLRALFGIKLILLRSESYVATFSFCKESVFFGMRRF